MLFCFAQSAQSMHILFFAYSTRFLQCSTMFLQCFYNVLQCFYNVCAVLSQCIYYFAYSTMFSSITFFVISVLPHNQRSPKIFWVCISADWSLHWAVCAQSLVKWDEEKILSYKFIKSSSHNAMPHTHEGLAWSYQPTQFWLNLKNKGWNSTKVVPVAVKLDILHCTETFHRSWYSWQI